MKKRYIFFRGLIRTLDLYTDEFVRLFTRQGAECLVVDAAQIEDEMIRLKAFLINQVTAVISLNNIGLHIEFEDGYNVWDKFAVPFYNIMMDHPFHYKSALDHAPEQMVLLCMDRNHADYVKRFFPHIKQVKFFPHAGIELLRNDSQRRMVPIAERKIDVLYAGGLSRYAAEGLIPDLGKIQEFDAFALVKSALERLIENPACTTEYVIEQCMKEINLKFNDNELGDMITELRFLDSLAVSFYREQMIRTLTEGGITVTVFGVGWDRCEWDNPNLIYGGVVQPIQILELMNESKVVLNSMTWFKRGAHDRIFNGMLAGSAVVSDSSEYLQEQFVNGEQLEMFDLQDQKVLAETVRELLSNEICAQAMADCGYQDAKEHHMWINRFCDIQLL